MLILYFYGNILVVGLSRRVEHYAQLDGYPPGALCPLQPVCPPSVLPGQGRRRPSQGRYILHRSVVTSRKLNLETAEKLDGFYTKDIGCPKCGGF